ncbi:MAG: hypothetical protein J5843_01310 [Clostridia bacterium]|nr:hypothetical protein [Clostridia bacterium]
MPTVHRFARLFLIAALLTAVLFAAACSLNTRVINTGETYLDGSWYHDDGDLRVGYNFFNNGTGFLFIGSTVQTIRYGIYMNNLYLDIDGDLSVLPFGQDGDELLIGNIRFLPVTDPENGFSTDQSLESAAEPQGTDTGRIILIISATVVVLLVAAILIRFFRTRSKPDRNASNQTPKGSSS